MAVKKNISGKQFVEILRKRDDEYEEDNHDSYYDELDELDRYVKDLEDLEIPDYSFNQEFILADDESDSESEVLSNLVDYNEKFANSEPCLFRDDVIFDCLSILIGKLKPNPLLIGPAGCGKTAIVEDIARRLANNDKSIPEELSGYKIYELSMSSLVSGTSLRGDLERKVDTIINFASDPEKKAILFIDEIHMLGTNSSYESIAQQLKPALARGALKCIGATTLQENNTLKKDPAFNRRFNSVIVEELTSAQTLEIIKKFSEQYKDVNISDELLPIIVDMANEYHKPGSHRPDNAITLLDRAVCDEKVYCARNGKRATKISKNDIKRTALHIMTGHSQKEPFSPETLRKELSVIKGQDEVLEKVIELINRHELDLFPRVRPLTILFGGASGVGKTEVAKRIAKVVTGVDPIILNMTEYNNSATINNLLGSPVGYVGSDSKTELPFDKLESNPYQIIILDEFEKCDTSVKRLFMQVLEEGKLTDNRGNVIDFSRCIIIATTNAGYTTKKSIGFTSETNKVSVTELSDHFDVELLNRFRNHIYSFNSISESVYSEICANQYRMIVEHAKLAGKLEDLPKTIKKKDLERVVKESYNVLFGARPAEDAIKNYIEEIVLSKMQDK